MALIENIQGFLLQAKINGDPQNRTGVLYLHKTYFDTIKTVTT